MIEWIYKISIIAPAKAALAIKKHDKLQQASERLNYRKTDNT